MCHFTHNYFAISLTTLSLIVLTGCWYLQYYGSVALPLLRRPHTHTAIIHAVSLMKPVMHQDILHCPIFKAPFPHPVLLVLQLLKPPVISLSHLAWITCQKDFMMALEENAQTSSFLRAEYKRIQACFKTKPYWDCAGACKLCG